MLTPAERDAAYEFIRRVRRLVRADLVQASLFGSKARGSARPDSDVDVLLVFHRLRPDREPHATQAEQLAESVARESGVPITTWSVALVDLEHGNRTPMLVDALEDAIPLWCAGAPLPAVPFSPHDALRCVGALLRRIEEGGREFCDYLQRGDPASAAHRARDDVIRACTAILLTAGVTRPRRGDAVDAYLSLAGPPLDPPEMPAVLDWARSSYGPDGREDESPVPIPPCTPSRLSAVIDALRDDTLRRAAVLECRIERNSRRIREYQSKE